MKGTCEHVKIIGVERGVTMPPWHSPMQKITLKRVDGTVETRVDNEVGQGPFRGAGCPDPGRDWQKDIGKTIEVTLRDKVKGRGRTEDWVNIN
jgi:hypothetical protein